MKNQMVESRSSADSAQALCKYEALLACFRAGQMSDRQMQEHMRADPAFAAWVKERLA